MKKFFNLLFTATVMCAAVSMTSCSKDDDKDDPIVNEETKPVGEELKIYDAIVTIDLLTYYDVTLQLSNGEKTKEVTLSKENCEVADLYSADALEYVLYSIDGVKGIKTVSATVTPKDNIEHMLAETKTKVSFMGIGWMIDATYYPTLDKWEVSELSLPSLRPQPLVLEPSGLLDTDEKGNKLYLTMAKTFEDLLKFK